MWGCCYRIACSFSQRAHARLLYKRSSKEAFTLKNKIVAIQKEKHLGEKRCWRHPRQKLCHIHRRLYLLKDCVQFNRLQGKILCWMRSVGQELTWLFKFSLKTCAVREIFWDNWRQKSQRNVLSGAHKGPPKQETIPKEHDLLRKNQIVWNWRRSHYSVKFPQDGKGIHLVSFRGWNDYSEVKEAVCWVQWQSTPEIDQLERACWKRETLCTDQRRFWGENLPKVQLKNIQENVWYRHRRYQYIWMPFVPFELFCYNYEVEVSIYLYACIWVYFFALLWFYFYAVFVSLLSFVSETNPTTKKTKVLCWLT